MTRWLEVMLTAVMLMAPGACAEESEKPATRKATKWQHGLSKRGLSKGEAATTPPAANAFIPGAPTWPHGLTKPEPSRAGPPPKNVGGSPPSSAPAPSSVKKLPVIQWPHGLTKPDEKSKEQ